MKDLPLVNMVKKSATFEGREQGRQRNRVLKVCWELESDFVFDTFNHLRSGNQRSDESVQISIQKAE